jgi:hypothetical protein
LLSQGSLFGPVVQFVLLRGKVKNFLFGLWVRLQIETLIWNCGETLHTTAVADYSLVHNVEHKGAATHDV